eukprot:1360262-Alexandrium_andersonii.AAC.2
MKKDRASEAGRQASKRDRLNTLVHEREFALQSPVSASAALCQSRYLALPRVDKAWSEGRGKHQPSTIKSAQPIISTTFSLLTAWKRTLASDFECFMTFLHHLGTTSPTQGACAGRCLRVAR